PGSQAAESASTVTAVMAGTKHRSSTAPDGYQYLLATLKVTGHAAAGDGALEADVVTSLRNLVLPENWGAPQLSPRAELVADEVLPSDRLCTGPIEKGGLEFAVESFAKDSEDALTTAVVRVTNRSENGLRGQVGAFVMLLEDGRFGYPLSAAKGEGFENESLFDVGIPRRGEL